MNAGVPPSEAVFADEIQRKSGELRLMGLLVGGLLAVIGLPCFFFSDAQTRGYGYIGIGSGVLLLALFFLRSVLTPKRFLETLRTNPGSIVWIYQQRGNQSGVAIVIGLENGKREFFPVATPMREQLRFQPNHGDATRETALIDALRALAPRATVGFTPDNEKRFLAAPPSLRASG
jgi:hypothetical protein